MSRKGRKWRREEWHKGTSYTAALLVKTKKEKEKKTILNIDNEFLMENTYFVPTLK